MITIGKDGTVQIPEKLLKQARLEEGAPVSLVVTEAGGIVIQREERDPDQAWFWTEEWQRKEREADEDIAAGRVTGPMTGQSSLPNSSAGHNRASANLFLRAAVHGRVLEPP